MSAKFIGVENCQAARVIIRNIMNNCYLQHMHGRPSEPGGGARECKKDCAKRIGKWERKEVR